jgi:3-oxoacyl-[acyl-carrier protein] reductase
MSALEGKIAVVTGAANGLGRAHATYLASQGARVVVSDIGADRDGQGRTSEAADEVVAEIKSAGGDAVAHCGDVADWNDSKAMVQKAIDTWGDLHILVNNAGFLRDKMIFSMTEEDFDAVIRVHLKGHFCGMRHAGEYWRNASKAKGEPVYGRIISTASEAALFSSAGQPNYSAAKSGIVALTNSAAQGLVRYGVTANTIMPRARTRMVAVGPVAAMFDKPEEGFDTFSPDNVTPLVGFLASPDSANISGNLFVVWGQSVTVVGAPNLDHTLVTEGNWTHESVSGALGKHFEGKEVLEESFFNKAVG